MLEKIRKIAHNSFFKLFLLLLAIVFALSIGDITGSKAHVMATVGKEKITLNDFLQAKQDAIAKLHLKQSPTPAQQESISLNVATQLITKSLIDQETKALGIRISPETVAEYIRSDASFQKNGVFDLESYKRILEYNNLTEAKFLNDLSEQISSKFLINSLTVNLPLKKILSDYLYGYLTEKRSIALIDVNTQKTDITDITKENLQNYYQKNQAAFKTKEYRNFSCLTLSANRLKANTEVSDEELQKEYKDNKEEYSLPETRDFYHFLAPNQEIANKVTEALKANANPAKVAQDFISQKVVSEIFNNQPEKSFLSNLDPSLFQLNENDVTVAVKSDLGWHIFKIIKINHKEYKSFAQAKAEMIENIKYRMSEIQLYELLKIVEDEIASGADFNEIASRHSLQLIKVQQIAEDGTYAVSNKNNIEVDSAILKLAFQTPLHEESPLTLIDNNQEYVAIRVSEIVDSAIANFDLVEDQVKAMYIEEKRDELALEIANLLQTKLAENSKVALDNNFLASSLSSISDKYKLSLDKLAVISFKNQDIIRPILGSNGDLSENFVTNLFTIEVNKTSVPQKIKAAEYAFALVQKISETTEVDKRIYPKIVEISEENYRNEIYDQYLNYLRSKYSVELNMDLIRQSIAGAE